MDDPAKESHKPDRSNTYCLKFNLEFLSAGIPSLMLTDKQTVS